VTTRPPLDPHLRKGRPVVDSTASKVESLPELRNRGHQLILEPDRQHQRIHDEVKSALRPEHPPRGRGVKAPQGADK